MKSAYYELFRKKKEKFYKIVRRLHFRSYFEIWPDPYQSKTMFL